MKKYLIVYVRHDKRLKFQPWDLFKDKPVRDRKNATWVDKEKQQILIDILNKTLLKNPAFEYQIKEISV